MKQLIILFILPAFLHFAKAQSNYLNVEISLNDLAIGGVSAGFF